VAARRRAPCGLLLALSAFGAGGCATLPEQATALPPDAGAVELRDTPFYPQERYQCGPAALATVLEASGIDVDLALLVDKVYLPGRRGSLKVELLAAARTSGRVAYVIPPTLAALYAELEAGRPVLVLQNLGVAAYPRWHYAVVVGVDAGQRQVVLRSGTDARRVTRLKTFLRTWQRGDFWGVVVLEPGELPAAAERRRYLDAMTAFEPVGDAADLLRGWRAAADVWPQSQAARFGVANALYASGDLEPAEAHYRELLAADGTLAAVRNNLAMTLAEMGRYDEALTEIERAIADGPPPSVVAELDDTRAMIVLRRQGEAGPHEP
jgi:tetratricopeptide (TPR) repeat protein